MIINKQTNLEIKEEENIIKESLNNEIKDLNNISGKNIPICKLKKMKRKK